MAGDSAPRFKPWPRDTYTPPQAPPSDDPDRALKFARANKVLHLSLLAFAFTKNAEEWFFVDSVHLDRIVVHVDRDRAEETSMYVEASFDDVDWGFIGNQFAVALPNVHERWYFFLERRRKRVWVHARPLVQ
jgi:hypothetical protein